MVVLPCNEEWEGPTGSTDLVIWGYKGVRKLLFIIIVIRISVFSCIRLVLICILTVVVLEISLLLLVLCFATSVQRGRVDHL